MSPSRSHRFAPGRVRGILRSLVSTALVALVVVALVTAGTLYAKHRGENGAQAELSLQAAATEFHRQDALEWRSISGRVPLKTLRRDLAVSRSRALASINRAGSTGLSVRGRGEVLELYRTYERAVDEELRLVSAGRAEEAGAHDATVVDPAFEAAQEALDRYTLEVSVDAVQAQRAGDAGVVLALVVVVLASALQGRRRLAEVRRQQQRRSEERYRALVDQSADIVVVTDRDGAAQYLSPSAERLLGARLDGGAGLGLLGRAHPDDRDLLAATLAAVESARGTIVAEVRLSDERHARGWRTFEVAVQDLRADAAIGGLVLTGHDVTDRHRMQREMAHRALHDALTGLPNRALLAERLDEALHAARRDGAVVGLLLIDLDRFKEINDTLGHHCGDQLLVQVGPRFAGVLPKGHTVARLGGDEFAVLLPSVADTAAAIRVAHELQAALSRPFRIEDAELDVELDVEASIGVVVSGEHGTDATTLTRRADIAMYVAKQCSLRVATYDPVRDVHTPERLALLGDLRRALHNGELVLHYQPQVTLRSGVVSGAEALVRWQHPEQGLTLPDAFIPLAENTGLIGPLTRHVLDLALAQARRWVDQGTPVQVAVNLSARNLLDEHLDQTVSELLGQHGVPAHLLKLEVTESAIMTDPTRANELLHRLAALGIEVSIDDFGVGYTSLSQLRNLPLAELKIDRSYVAAMDDVDSGNSLIVRSLIELGHNLGLSIVAEGVECPLILDRLRSYGCDVVQGFLLARPAPADEFERWRAAWPGMSRRPGAHASPALPHPRVG